VKDFWINLILVSLIGVTYCVPARADGLKFPTIPNPFKKASTNADSSEPPRATGTNLSDDAPTERERAGFSLPKPKMPKFDLPSFGRDNTDAPATRTASRGTTTTRQSRANHNRRPEPSTFDKFSQGTKSFFSKAKTTLMPWSDDDTALESSAPSGSGSRHAARTNSRSRTASRSSSQDRDASSGGGFSFPWFKPKPEPQEREINSATDFLRMDRPKYY